MIDERSPQNPCKTMALSGSLWDKPLFWWNFYFHDYRKKGADRIWLMSTAIWCRFAVLQVSLSERYCRNCSSWCGDGTHHDRISELHSYRSVNDQDTHHHQIGVHHQSFLATRSKSCHFTRTQWVFSRVSIGLLLDKILHSLGCFIWNSLYITLSFVGCLPSQLLQLLVGGGFKCFIFSPQPREMIQFDEHLFQMGWFNHQLPWEPTTFIFRGYNPCIGGLNPSSFMVLGSKGS